MVPLPIRKVSYAADVAVARHPCGPCRRDLAASCRDLPRWHLGRLVGTCLPFATHYKCAKTARSSSAEGFPLDVQETEENFDLSLIASLEIDVVPYLGETTVPDYVVQQLARVLHQGSRLRSMDDDLPPSPSSIPEDFVRGSKRQSMSFPSHDFDKLERFGKVTIGMGTTAPGRFLPRERFSYWCFDLLFLICSDVSQGEHELRCLLIAF